MFLGDLPVVPVAPSEALFFFLFVGSLGTVLGLILSVLHIVSFFRRSPPIEAEFPTKKELNEHLDQLRSELERVEVRNEELNEAQFRKLDDLTRSVNVGFQEVHRSLGRLEGRPS